MISVKPVPRKSAWWRFLFLKLFKTQIVINDVTWRLDAYFFAFLGRSYSINIAREVDV